jgi:DNA polymerase (family 10)
MPEVKKISPAGSLRRKKETVRDIDILVVSAKPQKIMDAFIGLPPVKEVLAKGKTKASVRTENDVQLDCRVVDEKSFGAALLYFTGSKTFNIKLRMIAQRLGLKINEYGIYKKEKYLSGRTEEGIFKLLGMPYIEPELREDNGEIELAQKFKLPDLIELKDIEGDLHVHSNWSDGDNSIEEMAKACLEKGYSYVAITDHSQSLKVAGGLSIPDLKKKRREIDKINKKLNGFRILYGTEADIDAQGDIDYKDEVLKEFDLVVAAIHSGFKQSRERLTKRIIKACQNRYVHIIAHPTGRLWGLRDAYDLDFEEICKVARDTNTNLEINSFSGRLDLNDLNCRRAGELGVKIAIDTDAHATEQLDSMELGLSVARRGWLSREDVLNSLGIEELLKKIKK